MAAELNLVKACRVTVQAPSNIALVKYMGKISKSAENSANMPENSSLSLTLDALSTWIQAEWHPHPDATELSIEWQNQVPSLAPHFAQIPELKPTSHQRMERFIQTWLGPAWRGRLVLRTANTFPADSGIASSASSFAAATLLIAELGRLAKRQSRLGNVAVLSRIARQGSGSACRSIAGPWVLWQGEGADSISVAPVFDSPSLFHSVALISRTAKTVGSSEAHARVKTSPLWQGRVARVEERLSRVLQALKSGDLGMLAQETWSEAWEMHSLFHTARPPFTYWEPQTLAVLRWLKPWVEDLQNPVLVTIDAGPNVHVISGFRQEGTASNFRMHWAKYLETQGIPVLWDRPGKGARVVQSEFLV